MKLWIRIALGVAVTAAVVLGNVVSHAYGLEQSARAFAKIIDEVNTVEIGALRGGPVTTTR